MSRSYNKKVGDFGESLACDFLKRKGYEIVARNIKLSYQEIDIIAKHNKFFIFIEVKTRTSFCFGKAMDAMNFKKIDNFKNGVMSYICENRVNMNFVRLDFISVDISKQKKTAKIKHFKDII